MTVYIPELFFELIPELLAFLRNLRQRLPIFWINPSHLHPDGHNRCGKRSAERPPSSDPPAKSGGQLGDHGILNPKILLETQGDRFGSVKALVKVAFRFFRHKFRIVSLLHNSSFYQRILRP